MRNCDDASICKRVMRVCGCVCAMRNMHVHIRFPAFLWHPRNANDAAESGPRRTENVEGAVNHSRTSARKITGAARYSPQNTMAIIFPGLFTRFSLNSLLLLSLFLFFFFFVLIVENVRRYKKVSRGTHSTHLLPLLLRVRPLAMGFRLVTRSFVLHSARVFDARNEWREVNTGILRRRYRPACPACFVLFHLYSRLTSQRPALRHRFSSSCVWLSGTSRKRGGGSDSFTYSSVLFPSFTRQDGGRRRTRQQIFMDGPAWCGRSNKSLIVLTILSVLHEREFLFLY